MSATGRRDVRVNYDDYPTPKWVVDMGLELVVSPCPAGRWLEPAAGDGRIVSLIAEKWPNATVTGVDIQDRVYAPVGKGVVRAIKGDFRHLEGLGYYDRIVTNPPYALAEDFLVKSIELLVPGGQLALLLRLAFLEGQGRADRLWSSQAYKPKSVHVLSRRPSFTGKGTDATAYAWFVWERGFEGETKLGWL